MTYKVIYNHISCIIKEINTYNQFANKILYKSFDNKYQKELWMIFLYFSQIELFKNIQSLLTNKNPIAIPILTRSSIDIVVLMKICNKDHMILLSKYKGQTNRDLDKFKGMLNDSNLKKLTKTQAIKVLTFLKTYAFTIGDLKDIQEIKLLEKDKRKKAEIIEALEELYNQLSDHVHHGYDTLITRHGINKSYYRASSSKKINKNIIYVCLKGFLLCLQSSLIELIKCVHLPGNHNLEKLYAVIKKLDKILQKHIENCVNT